MGTTRRIQLDTALIAEVQRLGGHPSGRAAVIHAVQE